MSNLIEHAQSLFGENPVQMVGLKRINTDGFIPYRMGVRAWTDNFLYKLNEKLWASNDNLAILNWLNSSNIDYVISRKSARYSHDRIEAKKSADKYYQVVVVVNKYVNQGSRTTANYSRTNAKTGKLR